MAKKAASSASKYGPVGEEDIKLEDLQPSFLKLVQKTSKIPGSKPGDIVDNTTYENFGTSVVIVPVKKYVDWIKFNEDNQVEDRSFDGVTWQNSGAELTDDERWKDKRINFMVFVEGYPTELPYVLSFGKTSYKAGVTMDNAISKNIKFNKEPIFARKFKLSSARAENRKGQEYFIYEALLDEATDEETMEAANAAYEMIGDMLKRNQQRLLAEPAEVAAPAPKAGKPAAAVKVAQRRKY